MGRHEVGRSVGPEGQKEMVFVSANDHSERTGWNLGRKKDTTTKMNDVEMRFHEMRVERKRV